MTFYQLLNLPRPVFAAETGAGAGDPPADAGDPPAGAGDPPAGAGDPPAPAENSYAWFGDELAADEKQYLEAKSFTKPRDLFKSLRAAETMIRGDKISGPPEDIEKQGEWFKESGLAKRLGIPAEAKDYGVNKPEFDASIAPNIPYDDERHGRFLDAAHKMNLTPAQAKGALDFYAQEMGGDAKQYAESAQADETEMQTKLTKEWGDAYDTNVRASLEVAQEVGLDERAIESLRTGNVAGSATLTKILHELAIARGNDTLKGGGAGGAGGQTKESANAALKEFTSKNGKALTTNDHPEHASAMARMEELKRAAGRGSGVA
jgi:hypothetical protein